jgi:hypothetical protein
VGLEGFEAAGQEVAQLLHVRQQPDRQAAGLPGLILQKSVSAENLTDKFSPSNYEQISTQKQQT